jgi:hypothetical protein
MIFVRLTIATLQKTIISSDLNSPKLGKAIIPPKTAAAATGISKPSSSLGAKAALGSSPLESASSFFEVVKYVKLLEESSVPKPLPKPTVLNVHRFGLLSLPGLLNQGPHSQENHSALMGARDLAAADKLFLRLEKVLNLPENKLKNLNTDDHLWSTLSIAESLSLGKQKR